MPAQHNQTVWSFYLSSVAGSVAVGKVLCLNAAGDKYVVSTAANRALQTLGSVCVALEAGDGENNPAVEGQFVGLIPNSTTKLGPGDAGPIRVSTTGDLERVAAPGPADEIVGKCDEDGNALVNFALSSQILALGGTGPTIINGGTGPLDNVPSDEAGSPADVIDFAGGLSMTVLGIEGGTESRVLFVYNSDNDANLTISNQASGIDAQSIITPGGTDLKLPWRTAACLVYDINALRWRVAGFSIKIPTGDPNDVVGIDGNGRLINLGPLSDAYSPPWYDPRDYGALLDGTTDDLPAFDAMYADMPSGGGLVIIPGYAWISDVWRVNKQITILGTGGGVRGEPPPAGLEVAPGREAALALGPAGAADAAFSGALRHHVSHLTFRSRCMIHPVAGGTSGGAAAGGCLKVWSNGAVVRKGEVFVAGSSATPTRCFRCTDTGLGVSASVFDVTQPTWNTTIGGTTTHGGMTFVTEAVVSPTTHQTSHAYVVGDRVFALNDNRFVFECTVAGTSAGSRPGELAGGDKTPTGLAILATVTDGGVTWRIRIMDGVYCNAPEGTIQFCEVQGFTTVGYRHQGGVGQDSRYTTSVDNFRNLGCYAQYCGAGWYAQGDDANGWTIDNPVANFIGWFHPKPFVTLASELGLGGHIIHEHTQVGGTVSNLYCQDSTGRPILKSSSSSRLMVVGCTEETVTESHFLADSTGQTTIVGGQLPVTSDSSLVLKLDQQGQGRGITEKDATGAVPLIVTLMGRDGVSAYGLQALDDNDPNGVNDLRYRYGTFAPGSRAGHWAMAYGSQTANTAFLLSTAKAGTATPGAGWLTFPYGHLVGNPASTAVFRGSEDSWTWNHLRGGARKTGDWFVSGGETRVCTSDGFKGIPWTAHIGIGTDTVQPYAPWALPGTMIEPTANTGTSAGGEKVFRCTVEGAKGGSEPNWSTAVSPGDTVTDNTVTWTLVGFTPSWSTFNPAEIQIANTSIGTLTDVVTTNAAGVRARVLAFEPGSEGVINLSSLASPVEARVLWIVYTGDNALHIKSNTGGTSTNRIITPDDLDYILGDSTGKRVVPLVYDKDVSRWRVEADSQRILSFLQWDGSDNTTVKAPGGTLTLEGSSLQTRATSYVGSDGSGTPHNEDCWDLVELTTPGATPTAILTVTPLAGSTTLVEARLVACDYGGGGESATFIVHARATHNGFSDVVVTGVQQTFKDQDIGLATTAVTVTGSTGANNFTIDVTGVVARDLRWKGKILRQQNYPT